MRFKVISCEVLARQVYYVAAFSPHVVDVELVAKGLHDEPDVLRAEIQRRLDAVAEGAYDAILLGYGLCSNSIAGVRSEHTQLVVPRAHDCITLYLGSKERYAAEFRAHPGTYWFTADYIERGGEGTDYVSLGSGSDEKMAKTYQEYVAKFGQDNADYLMEVMGAWRQHYDRAAYIDTAEMTLPDYKEQVRDLAGRRGWRMECLEGSLIVLRDLLEGRWDEERFQIVPPGYTLIPSYDERIVRESER
ncbi:MAG: DUF1638 domain-containing protein [Chloroflexi bacterium]|nr:DUF1638 domain-containing protein [Chloroflexota bacterium]